VKILAGMQITKIAGNSEIVTKERDKLSLDDALKHQFTVDGVNERIASAQFLNNRGVLAYNYRTLQGEDLSKVLLNEVADINKYTYQSQLDSWKSQDYSDIDILRPLLLSANTISGTIPFHSFENIKSIRKAMNKADASTLKLTFPDWTTLLPLVNIGDYLTQTTIEDLKIIGDNYLALAKIVARKLDYTDILPRIDSLLGIRFLEQGDDQKLSPYIKTPNHLDYIKELNAISLSIYYRDQGELADARLLEDKAVVFRKILNIQPLSAEWAMMMIPLISSLQVPIKAVEMFKEIISDK